MTVPNVFGTSDSSAAGVTADDVSVETDERTGALKRTLRFVYQHSTVLVPLSVLWLCCLLPVVTIGPATVSVYAVVLSLRERGSVDYDVVLSRIRDTAGHAALLGLLPLVFGGIGILYLVDHPFGGLSLVVSAVALYAGAYAAVVLVPTFAALAAGDTVEAALRRGYVWTARRPTVVVRLVLVTTALLVATVALTLAFVLLFGALVCTYQLNLLADTGFFTTTE